MDPVGTVLGFIRREEGTKVFDGTAWPGLCLSITGVEEARHMTSPGAFRTYGD